MSVVDRFGTSRQQCWAARDVVAMIASAATVASTVLDPDSIEVPT